MSHTPLRYSQNFLRDPRLIDRIVADSSITKEDVVIEIGPGKGIITDRLARVARRVVAIELDGELAERLKRRYAANPRVSIAAGDFMRYPLPEEPFKVFANIPFAYTSEIVTRLTSGVNPPLDAYLTMQREAAEKFCGARREYLYSVLLKPWFTAEIIYDFQRADFAPAPNVDVVLLRLKKRGPPLIAAHERQFFRDFIVYCFVTRQPTLDLILRRVFTHRQRRQAQRLCDVNLDVGPSALTFPQWLQLFCYFAQVGAAQARHAISGSERRLRQQQGRLRASHRTHYTRSHSPRRSADKAPT